MDKPAQPANADSGEEEDEEIDSDNLTDYGSYLAAAILSKDEKEQENMKEKILTKLNKYKDIDLHRYGTYQD